MNNVNLTAFSVPFGHSRREGIAAAEGPLFSTRAMAADGVNIAALTCTREARGGQALLAIELDQPLSAEALAFLSVWGDADWVRLLPKLMDG